MERYYDADGNDITEVVTKKFEDQNQAKIKEEADKVAALQAEVEAFKTKDMDVEKIKKESEDKVTALKTEFDTFKSTTITDKKNEIMKSYTGGNKQAQEKIEAELTALGLPMDSVENIQTAIRKAAAIVAPEVNALQAVGGRTGGRGSGMDMGNTPEVETQEQRNTRMKFGISDEMATKYAEDAGITPLVVTPPATK